MTSTVDIRRFAYRQGPGKRYLGEQQGIDDTETTTSLVPPARARGVGGVPLPLSTQDRLAATPFPGPVDVPAGERLGHLLLMALGLQRREPENRYNDHRAVASGRAKFPVHTLVHRDGRLRYLDHYRHALVDVALDADPGPELAGTTTLLLAARYSDLPDPYGRLRYAVGELELGVTVRALCTAAQALGVPARLVLDGERCRRAAAHLAGTGPGDWSAPVLVDLDGLPDPPTVALPGRSRPVPTELDALLDRPSPPSVAEARAVSAARLELSTMDPPPARAIPAAAAVAGDPSWAGVLWDRGAGRAPGRRWGFACQPGPVPAGALDALVDWAAVPPPHPLLAGVAGRLRTSLLVRGVTGRTDGLYRLEPTGPRLVRADSRVLAAAQAGFGQPPAPDTDSGLRHAAVVAVTSARVGDLLAEHGAAGLGLLNLACGWASHGICLAAARYDLAARPARSYDEHHLAPLLDLPPGELPVFLTACGRSRHIGLQLDLRP